MSHSQASRVSCTRIADFAKKLGFKEGAEGLKLPVHTSLLPADCDTHESGISGCELPAAADAEVADRLKVVAPVRYGVVRRS